MNHSKKPFNILLLAAALALPGAAWADQPPPPGGPGQHPGPAGAPPFMHRGPGQGPGFGHGFGHGFGGAQGQPPFLRGLDLSETQQDQVFAITHEQAPALREQHKAAAKARQELRALSRAAQFDEARAAALAQAEGQAIAAISLQRARSEQKILALLTPEQRKQLEQRFTGPQRGPRPQ
ncbi:Spy/CpxP family protein refolding chaperone [Janthinobacterium agaricidamnosum]|uniref:LTXXQ motif family protein n=1 Tax=Janthinobacterium agaricidamnosum NBRC 102515 = DSM 9628 TaxID=1349767 RepID=W0V660_9BURK|nr:Spy/CpxP family protein refolding chaperone [Janthinobacterium agaricidamnosum]CDG82838.1 LTXXQ motif family protein [Janthinobacterium agaricidamnosum NBRC 102515 = DSM 9628]